ncbi:DNA polymerase ligase N-terminal domain-containing protein [Streptomyces silvisoli]|uniref:DNA polymerase ligase N-terminal domain-containing protein n=1 Tax=Streptomyces silvisoli TaxID=3034235 RepID=A0ABT5ZWI8_9ACTN|nr:DNA polymerase ligase N-terminal domain-containing protein [Streptomyces silvisoli]MDF3293874.1 DNA polymerase ligase N-terminal domain-containing protein [Streptomyces silvisoli]
MAGSSGKDEQGGKSRSGRSADSLRKYHGKRTAERTPEPMGGASPKGGKWRFVVQKHAATALHYDFRLEAGGVLKSWAVPKGPSTNPKDKRLAMRTEDHPVDYLGFEGVIPRGEYGAGKVIVWDTGTYRNLTERDGKKVPVSKGVDEGHIKVWLEGEKLHGGYALTRTGRDGDRERWIMIKLSDEGADARRNPVSTEPASVRSGRTLDELDDS